MFLPGAASVAALLYGFNTEAIAGSLALCSYAIYLAHKPIYRLMQEVE